LLFGNFSGHEIDNFGGDAQYGAPNLAHFFGQNTSGPVSNQQRSLSVILGIGVPNQ
jgi:hypothetical protein